jgi:hypothetical protein
MDLTALGAINEALRFAAVRGRALVARVPSLARAGLVTAVVMATLVGLGAPAGATTLGSGILSPGQKLLAKDSATSPSHLYTFVMQGDGNLVLYVAGPGAGSTAIWNSRTQGHPGAYAIMQGDGNLVVYYSGRALWNSGTSGHPGAHAVVQNDGNTVIYDTSGRWLWQTRTGGRQYPFWFTATSVCNHVFRIDSPTMAYDPAAMLEVSRSITFGSYTDGNGQHCVYKLSDTVGIDVNTRQIWQLKPYYQLGWHWDVLAAAAAGYGVCNPPGVSWYGVPLPVRAAVDSWCAAVGAIGYVLS